MSLSNSKTNPYPSKQNAVMIIYGESNNIPAKQNMETGKISRILWNKGDPSYIYNRNSGEDFWLNYDMSWWNGFGKFKSN